MREINFSKPLIGIFHSESSDYIELRNADDIQDLTDGTRVIILELNHEERSRLSEYYHEKLSGISIKEVADQTFCVRTYQIREDDRGIKELFRRKRRLRIIQKNRPKVDLPRKSMPQKIPMRQKY